MRRRKSGGYNKNAVRVPPSPCVECGRITSGAMRATPGGRIVPNPGDMSICIYCGSLSIYGDDLRLRQPTVDEYVESTHILEIQLARAFISERNDKEKLKMSQK